jgi:hypothetical protein
MDASASKLKSRVLDAGWPGKAGAGTRVTAFADTGSDAAIKLARRTGAVRRRKREPEWNC